MKMAGPFAVSPGRTASSTHGPKVIKAPPWRDPISSRTCRGRKGLGGATKRCQDSNKRCSPDGHLHHPKVKRTERLSVGASAGYRSAAPWAMPHGLSQTPFVVYSSSLLAQPEGFAITTGFRHLGDLVSLSTTLTRTKLLATVSKSTTIFSQMCCGVRRRNFRCGGPGSPCPQGS